MMAEKDQSHKSVASYLNLGPNPIGQLNSVMSKAREMRDEEEKLLPPDEYTSITSEDDFIIIEEDDIGVDVMGLEQKGESSCDCTTTPQVGGQSSSLHPLPLSSMQQRFLKDKRSARQSVCQQLEQQGFKATFDFDHAAVYIEGKDCADEALNTIQTSVMEIKVDLTEEELQKMAGATDIPDGEPISPLPMLSSDQEILVVINRSEGNLRIVGLTDAVSEIRETLRKSQELLNPPTPTDAVPQDPSIEQNPDEGPTIITVPIRESAVDYLVEYKLDEISALATDANGLSIEMTDDSIEVKGPQSARNVAVDVINALVGQIRSDKFTLDAGVNMGKFTDVSLSTGKKHKVMISYKQSNISIMNRNRITSIAAPQGGPSDRSGTSRVRQEAKVRIVFNRLERHQADVLVNTTNKELSLGNGQGVSNSVFKAAGGVIQQQLKTVYPHGMTHGDLAVSGPGNLTTCKTIYHAALPYHLGIGETMKLAKCYEYLVSAVFQSLIKASCEGHQTIAFPAFGTGALEYPTKNVVQLMFKAIDRFSQDQRAGSIKQIDIVITPETRLEVKQLFLAQQFTHQMKTRHIKGPEEKGRFFAKKQDTTPLQYFRTEVGKTTRPKCEVRVKIGDTLLQVIHGDIKKACDFADIIMVPWIGEEINTLNDKPVFKCIDADRQQWQCRSYVAELPESKSTADRTTLEGKTLIHTYTELATEKGMTVAFKQGLEKAVKENCRMVTLPISTEGAIAASPGDSAAAIVSAINGISSGMHVVTVVIPNNNIFIDFVTKVAGMKKLEEPADINKTEFVDTLWLVTYSAQAVRSQTRAAAFNTGVDAVMVVTSDSEQKNRAAAEEVATELNVPLYDVVRTRRE